MDWTSVRTIGYDTLSVWCRYCRTEELIMLPKDASQIQAELEAILVKHEHVDDKREYSY